MSLIPSVSRAALWLAVSLTTLAAGLSAHEARSSDRPPPPKGAQEIIFSSSFEPWSPPPGCAGTPAARDADGDGLFDAACILITESPNPSTVAPPLDPTVPADFGAAVGFLYESPQPVQHGALPDAFEEHRIAVVRGYIEDDQGAPLPGVLVRVVDHPEYGYTYTREDGLFDLAVNGGGDVVLDYRKSGYLQAQRTVAAPWRDWEWAENATLVPLNPVVTKVLFGPQAPPQVVRTGLVSDEDGEREAVLLFPSATSAHLERFDGSHVPAGVLHVRATEYTVGERGLSRMPAALPPSTAYTYAADFNADEAIAANARSVVFDKPVGFYLDNFLGFPVGSLVPAGYYDMKLASWLPSTDGLVVKVLATTGGVASLDIDGSGLAASNEDLLELGISFTERQQLASAYEAGTELWRTPLTHFTPWDCNFPYGPEEDDEPPPEPPEDDEPSEDPCDGADTCDGDDEPNDPDGDGDDDVDEDEEDECGSWIRCEEGSLQETIPVAGTNMGLVYNSKRVPALDYDERLRVRVSNATVPRRLTKAELTFTMLGIRRQVDYNDLAPNTVFNEELPRTDAYGRVWTGGKPWKVSLTYHYPVSYQIPTRDGFNRAWGRFGREIGFVSNRERTTFGLTRVWEARTSRVNQKVVPADWDAKGLGMGGWFLNAHHVLDRDRWVIYLGDGSEQRIGMPGRKGMSVAQTLLKEYGSQDLIDASRMDAGPDGSVFVLARAQGESAPGGGALWRHTFTGAKVQVANLCNVSGVDCVDEVYGYAGPDIPHDVAVDDRGFAYVLAGRFAIEVSPSGTMKKVFDGAAASASCAPQRIEAWRDRAYLTCGGRVFALWRDGQVTRMAGGGASSSPLVPDGFPFGDLTELAVDSEGSIYVVDASVRKLFKLRRDGVVEHVAGDGSGGALPNGGVAKDGPLGGITSLSVRANGDPVYAVDWPVNEIRELRKNGRVYTLVGGGGFAIDGLRGRDLLASDMSVNPADTAVLPDGSLLFMSKTYAGASTGAVIGTVASSFSASFDGYGALETQGYRLISKDGRLEYHFDEVGHHLSTRDTTTGAVVTSFIYDADGVLTGVADSDGDTTEVVRDPQTSLATRLVAPDGQVTELNYDERAMLSDVEDPLSRHWKMAYDEASGLIERFEKPREFASTFTWQRGRLASDVNAEGGGWTLDTNEWLSLDASETRVTSAMGRLSRYIRNDQATGGQNRVVRRADGTGHTLVGDVGAQSFVFHRDGVEVEEILEGDPRFDWNAPFVGQRTITIPGASSTGGDLVRQETETRAAASTGQGAGAGQFDLDFSKSINGREYRRQYDAATRTWTMTTPSGLTARLTLDAQGRPSRQELPGMAPLDYAFNERGRIQTITQGGGVESRVQRFGYDGHGWVDAYTNAEQHRLALSRNVVGRIESIEWPDSTRTAYRYDANDNLVGITPPGRDEHTFEYDKADRLTVYRAPLIGGVDRDTTLTRNLDGQARGMLRPGGEFVEIAYAPTTGLPSLVHSNRMTPLPVNVDGYGRLHSAERYDATFAGPLMLSQVSRIPVSASASASRTVRYTYDTSWRVRGIDVGTAPSAHSSTLTYDQDSNLRTLVLGARTLTYNRSPTTGLPSTSTVSNVSDAMGFNDFAELVTYAATVSGSPSLSFAYQRDRLGRITRVEETAASGTRVSVYGYDVQGRLASVTTNGASTATFTYGNNANIDRITYGAPSAIPAECSDGQMVRDATFDAHDRMLSLGTCSFAYTDDGSLETKQEGSGGATHYSYDAFSNLRSVELPDGREVGYVIDGLNRRIAKTVDGDPVQAFLYKDQLKPVAELDGAGNVVSMFAYGQTAHVPALMRRDGQVFRFITDHLGSVRQVINVATGQVAQEMDYDHWGRVTTDTAPGFQPFGYAGGIYDKDTGLVRFGSRDYDPVSGRWTTKDPSYFAGTDTNLYRYGYADPINYIDPTGHVPFFVPFIVAYEAVESFKLGWDIGDTIEAKQDFDLLKEEIARVRAEIEACPPNDPRFTELYEELAQLQAGYLPKAMKVVSGGADIVEGVLPGPPDALKKIDDLRKLE